MSHENETSGIKKYGSFPDGYYDGWKSVLGRDAPLPGIPFYVTPAAKTDYHHGYDEGRKAASEEVQHRRLNAAIDAGYAAKPAAEQISTSRPAAH